MEGALVGRLSWGSMIAVVKKDGKAMQKLEIRPGHCTVAPQMHCRPRKISRSTAWSCRECSTEAGKQARALQELAGSAVQRPEIRPGHCTVAPRVHCGSRKTGQGTARVSRKCSTEAGKKAGALRGRAGSALRKPENRPGHCTVARGVQYRSRKTGKRNARKTDRSSCKYHFMFREYLMHLISTIDECMVDNICKQRGDSRPELKTQTENAN